MKLAEKKRIYIELIETLVMNGYDISDMLNPNYSNLNFDFIQSEIIRLNNLHQ